MNSGVFGALSTTKPSASSSKFQAVSDLARFRTRPVGKLVSETIGIRIVVQLHRPSSIARSPRIPMRTSKIIHIISCHAEGEVGDVIVGGVAPPPGGSARA
jgi:hypothetical protein